MEIEKQVIIRALEAELADLQTELGTLMKRRHTRRHKVIYSRQMAILQAINKVGGDAFAALSKAVEGER